MPFIPTHTHILQGMTVCVRCGGSWLQHTHTLQGIACNLNSDAFKKIEEATKEVMGECKPYSITGSLPLVGDLQV